LNNVTIENSNNKKINGAIKENNKKDDNPISLIHNKGEKNLQMNNNNNIANNINNNLHSTNNLSNINNLNNVINIQNANFISTIQELSYGSQPEDNIEFSSKNICSTANLFYKNKDSGNNGNNFKQNNIMKNQTILDQFNIKSIANSNNSQRINDTKINSYFNKSNSNNNLTNNNNINNTITGNNSINNIEDKNGKTLKQNFLKLQEDNEKLIKDLGDKNKYISEKEKESEKLKLIILDNELNLKTLNILNKNYENQINQGKNSLIKYLKDYEELKRIKNKIWLNEQAYRLGKFSIQRMGHRVIEAWEDGEEIINVKNIIKTIKETKEDLEKLKKRLAAVIKKKDSNKDLKDKGDSQRDNNKEKNEFLLNNNYLNNSSNNNSSGNNNGNNNFLHPMNIFHSNNLFTYGHNGNLEEYTDHEILELRELINFKLVRLAKEESDCLEKLEKLEIEKIKYQIEFKRNMEEEKCRYGINSKEKWPILSNRYLILSLLGRGGYSEVYKVKRII